MTRLGFLPAATALALTAALSMLACGAKGERPGFAVFPDMYESVPYDAYDPNTITRGGQTLLTPPEGTIPVGFQPFPYAATKEEAERAGREVSNPLQPTPENIARGKAKWSTTCIVCHGPNGDGDGPIIGRFPNPPSLKAEHALKLPDGQIFHVITRGQGIMPSHAIQVLPEDRWKVILYLRTLQASAPAGAPAPAVPVTDALAPPSAATTEGAVPPAESDSGQGASS